MKKNKEGLTVYSEEIYFPCEFRRRTCRLVMPPYYKAPAFMPVILTGWVNVETHISWVHQSLQ